MPSESPWRLPDHGRGCFDQLPATISRLLGAPAHGLPLDDGLLAGRFDHVVLVYLDAFGLRWLERHAAHPLLERAARDGLVRGLTSQFPSTTAAHITTIHTGQPVGEHGLYEWFVLEPRLERLIAPLLFSFAGDDLPHTLLAAGLAPGEVFPHGALCDRFAEDGAPSHVALPRQIAGSQPSRVLAESATIHPFDGTAHGLATLAAALGGAERGYGHLYLPDVDTAMHHLGRDDEAVDLLIVEALTAIEQALDSFPAGTLLLLTADHGMADVDPARTAYVNTLWPELADLLETGADGRPLAPAGACRDLFLHVRDGCHEEVRAGLAERLEGRAEVRLVEALVADGVFGSTVGVGLLERLADVVVLPYAGEAVYWWEPGRFEQRFLGQHGGLTPDEMEIPLVGVVCGS